MGLENIQANSPESPAIPSDPLADLVSGQRGKDALRSPEALKRLSKVKEWFYEARIRQAENRYEQARDADYYDGLQWLEQDILELRDRHQAPLVFNKTAQYINWILGTERRTRVDFHVYSREADGDDTAEIKTKLLKWISDVNHAQFARSRAFGDAVKSGVGWLEDGINSTPGDEPLYSRNESWRNIWWDMYSTEPDLSDARYLHRAKYTDLAIAQAMFPERKDDLQAAASLQNLFSADDEDLGYAGMYTQYDRYGNVISRPSIPGDATFYVGHRRPRVLLVETWYREPTAVTLLHTDRHPLMHPAILTAASRLHGKPYDATDPLHQFLLQHEYATLYHTTKLSMRVALWCSNLLLQDSASPYRHDQFPFTPIWGYRRGRDNAPYGAIRNMRDPQEDLNKRRSKALHILSTNQVIMDQDAVEDLDTLAEEVARPDGIIQKKRGFDLKINRELDLAEEHVKLMEQDMHFLESSSGVTDENLGQETNAKSGIAIQARQTQGSVVTAILFDNLRYAIQSQGGKQLSLAEQFYTEPKVFRLTGSANTPEYVRINHAKLDDFGNVLGIENDLQRTEADFVVDEEDFQATVRQNMFQALLDLMGKLPPEVSLQLLDVVLEYGDIPGKEEIIKRVRKVNGQPDPASSKDPQAAAAAQAQQQQQAQDQAQQKQLQVQAALAESQLKLANARQSEASATKTQVAAMEQALQVAQTLSQVPGLAPAVDTLLAHASGQVAQQAAQTS
jgi:hypothetical protein